MDKATIIYEYIKDKIPGIIAAVGYGSEYDKTIEELEKYETSRKTDRTTRNHTINVIPLVLEEFNWKKEESQYDYLIFCNNVKESFIEAMKSFPECDTPTTRLFINTNNSESIIKETNVVYMTYIYIEPIKRYIKIGFCDYQKAINNIYTMDSLYIPFRLAKKTYVAKSTPEFDQALKLNRLIFDLVTGLVIPENEYPIEKHYFTAYNLSYGKDIRNGIAEDPKKVEKLIKNQYDYLEENYANDKIYIKYLRFIGDDVQLMIKKQIPEEWFELLPINLQLEITKVGLKDSNLTTTEDKELLSETILNYFKKRTNLESKIEPIRGVGSNGVLNSVAYLTRKLSKKRK